MSNPSISTSTPQSSATPPEHVRTGVLAACVAVSVTVGGLLVGYAPVGGDPDRLYRPIKTELAASAGSADAD